MSMGFCLDFLFCWFFYLMSLFLSFPWMKRFQHRLGVMSYMMTTGSVCSVPLDVLLYEVGLVCNDAGIYVYEYAAISTYMTVGQQMYRNEDVYYAR